jgi:aspartate carbamoyltransferase catalytic subunit
VKEQHAPRIDPVSGSQNNSMGLVLDPRHLLDAFSNRIDWDLLGRLEGQSLLGSRQLTRTEVVELAKFSALLELTEIATSHPLDGKICITAFFEASTRTRLSFESAVLRCDGKVLSVPDGKVTGIAKGESLADIGEMFNTYGDLVIMRHPETSAIEAIRRNLRRPLINAGNGTGEHPTQALLDWYALLKWRPDLAEENLGAEKLHLGIVGTPRNMRAVRSFLRTSLLFDNAIGRISVISENEEPLDSDIRESVERSPVEVDITNEFKPHLPELDVIYMNSIALLDGNYELLDAEFALDRDSALKEKAVILHPLARRDELDESLDRSEHNLYFAEAAGAVFLRQALLISVLGRIDALPGSIRYLAS